MTYEDIAGIMGISLANVTTRLFRIKEQFLFTIIDNYPY